MSAASPEADFHAYTRALLREHGAALRKFLARRGVDDDDTDDLLQEIILAAWRMRDTYDPRSAQLRTWLFAIAVNQVSHYHDRAHRRYEQRWPERLSPTDTAQPDPELALIQRDQVKLLHELLDKLPKERRQVFVLHELEDMTIPEIARALNISPNTASSRLRLARQDIEIVVRQWQAQERHAGRDGRPAVLPLLLLAMERTDQATTPARSSSLAHLGTLKTVKATALGLACAVVVPADALRSVTPPSPAETAHATLSLPAPASLELVQAPREPTESAAPPAAASPPSQPVQGAAPRAPSSGAASASSAPQRLDDAPSLREEADMVEAAEAELRNG
ncbi:MAG TPA: sigma-70 family RNA polymerase sigma factor, partial [Candidatus Nanopelagicales bacterium]|nr:sigma-70 family RNA polymerase sigma factor [Candidatus Nanopelagicales bacterium]